MTVSATTFVSRYAFPERALHRWVREHLTLISRADGGVEAVFRFEGSTCGNVAFNLVYQVAFGPAAAGHRIESMRCEAAPYDEGHARMCCWQDRAAVVAIRHGETPLLGQPVEAVLTWRPLKSPAGCLCTELSRHHKWQAVLETMHLALGQLAPHPFHENRTCP